MDNKIPVAKFTTILNEFIDDEDNKDLSTVLSSYSGSSLDYLNENLSLHFDDQNFSVKKPKIEACLRYIAEHHKTLDGNVGKLVYETIMQAADMGERFALDETTANKLLAIKAIVPEVIIPKSNRFMAFAKKYLRPAAITSVFAAGSTYAVHELASQLDLGAILGIVTDNAELTAISTATNSGIVTLTVTVGALVAIDKLTRNYYAKTYGIKANNIHKLLNQDETDAKTIAELNLPINELLNIMKATDEKMFENRESKNLLGKLHNKILLKQNRNRLHALYQFYHLLNKQIDTLTKQDANTSKLRALAKNIDDYIDNLMETSLNSVYQKQLNARFRRKFVLDRSDIIAKNTGKKLAIQNAGKSTFKKLKLKKEIKKEIKIAYTKKGVKNETNNLIEKLLMKYLTTGEPTIVSQIAEQPNADEFEPFDFAIKDTNVAKVIEDDVVETIEESTVENPIFDTDEVEATLKDFLDTPEEIEPFDFAIKDTNVAKVIEDDVVETIEESTVENPIFDTDEFENRLTEIEQIEDLDVKYNKLEDLYWDIKRIDFKDSRSLNWQTEILERIVRDQASIIIERRKRREASETSENTIAEPTAEQNAEDAGAVYSPAEIETTLKDFSNTPEEIEDLDSKHTKLNEFYNDVARMDNVSEDWRNSILERILNDILQTGKEINQKAKEEKLNAEQAEKTAKTNKSSTDKTAATKFAEAYILKEIKDCGEKAIASKCEIDITVVKEIRKALEEKASKKSTVTNGLGKRDDAFKEGFNKLFDIARKNIEGRELDLTIECSESTIKQVSTVIETTTSTSYDEFSSIPTVWNFD